MTTTALSKSVKPDSPARKPKAPPTSAVIDIRQCSPEAIRLLDIMAESTSRTHSEVLADILKSRLEVLVTAAPPELLTEVKRTSVLDHVVSIRPKAYRRKQGFEVTLKVPKYLAEALNKEDIDCGRCIDPIPHFGYREGFNILREYCKPRGSRGLSLRQMADFFRGRCTQDFTFQVTADVWHRAEDAAKQIGVPIARWCNAVFAAAHFEISSAKIKINHDGGWMWQ